MSKTVSFVARDELAEWLEQRAESEMKSISAVCQDIVAEEYKRQQSDGTSKAEQNHSEAAGDALERNPDAWYRPNSAKHDFAVRSPDGDETKYYKTREGAVKRVLRWYEGLSRQEANNAV
jgi:predicted transcriptional regulator